MKGNMTDNSTKLSLMQAIMWDYNISPQDCLDVLEGKKERAGHYDQSSLFRKVLESYPWFTVMELVPISRIKALLTDSLIHQLRSELLVKRYEFIRARLSSHL